MPVKTAYRAFFLPEWGGSVLKNAQPHGLPCDLGAWGFPPTSVPMAIIGQRDPACPFSSVLSGTKKYMAYETKNTPHSS